MSILVLLIAALHAIPIVLAGRITKKRKSVTKYAWIMVGISIVTGALVFTIVDLIAIWIAWRWTISRLPESEQGQSTQMSPTGRDNSSARTSATLPGPQSVAKVTPPLRPIEQSDLYSEFPGNFCEILDAAHEGGFRSYVESIPDLKRSEAARKKASLAMAHLHVGLRGKGTDPDYGDPLIAGAYQILYHLSHCIMAFRVWNALLRVMSEENSIPDRLFICDIGAGSDAGLIGLILALMERDADPHVRYVSIEPSDAMYEASRCFLDNFELWPSNDIDYTRYRKLDELSNLEKINQDMNIITAFHLSLEYDFNYNNYDTKGVNKLIKNIMNSIPFNIYMCTCHKDKSKHLIDALNQCIYTYKRGEIIMPAEKINVAYASQEKLHHRFGFNFPEFYDYWGRPEKDRFKTPTNAMLHYGWFTGTEEGFVPDDDLPF